MNKKGSVAVYSRKGTLIIHPISKTARQLGVATPPFIALSCEAGPAAIGAVVIQALEASRLDLPEPSDWSAIPKPIFEAAGVGSWAAFVRGTLHCTVDREGDVLEFIPTRRRGGAFEFLPRKHLVSLASSLEEIGLLVQDTLISSS